ncbi:thymosin beta-10-like [Apodemus sylvaticus]|nr:thymosin beta-10-like [Apodemus sylvaticus]
MEKIANMSAIGEFTSFNKTKLKKTEVHEKYTLPTKETIEQEERSEIT